MFLVHSSSWCENIVADMNTVHLKLIDARIGSYLMRTFISVAGRKTRGRERVLLVKRKESKGRVA